MNRIIKFRVWCKSSKEMTDHDKIRILPEEKKLSQVFLDDSVIWMQYTGLKDKNGKEIYDGDIVKCDDIVTNLTWLDGGFQMITSENQGKSPAIQDRLKRFEIIGNIYENPELIK